MTTGVTAQPLRIGIDCRFMQDTYHGIGRYVYELLQSLGAIPGDHSITAFVNPALPNTRFPLDTLANFARLQLREVTIPLYHPSELWRWQAELRRSELDVFHSPYFWAPLALPCPLVTTVHDMIFDRYPEYMPHRKYALVYRVSSRLFLRRSRRVIAVSAASRNDILQYTATNPDKVAVVHNGVGSSFKPVADPELRRVVRVRYDLPDKFVLALGARRPHKNIGHLIASFSRVADEVPHVLLLVGTIDQRFPPDVVAEVVRLKEAGKMQEIEQVAEADLATLYSLADVFVQPSLIEGFGLPVLEAMACGCAVACSDTSSLPEIAGQAAAFFDPHDQQATALTLRSMLVDEPRRTDFVQRGLRQAQQFTWQHAAAQTLSVYASAIRHA